MSKPNDIYLDMGDLQIIIFSAFYAFAQELEPEAIERVLTLLRAVADSPARMPAAAEGLRGLVRFIEGGDEPGDEPEEEPKPRFRFKIIDGGAA